MGPLATLVGDVDEFAREVWGRRPLRHRSESASPAPFDVGDVDRIITSVVRTPAIRLVRGGERVPPEDFCTPTRIGNRTLSDVADVRKVLDQYRRGATVVLQALHRTWAPLSAWCADLEAELGWPVQCNAYLSPPGSAGLAKHSDGHDVFAVQLFGAKAWYVAGLGDLVLHPIDVLYVPAGVEHVAGTEADPSLHLTIGVHRPGAEALARAALAIVDRPSADPVPLGRADDLTNDLGGAFETTARHLATAFAAAADRPDAADSFGARVRRTPRKHLGGVIADAVRRPTVDGDTVVRVRPCRVRVGVDDDRARVAWDDVELSLPSFVAPALQLLARSGDDPLAIRELPGLDDEDRIVLARRLLDEGLLEIVGDASP